MPLCVALLATGCFPGIYKLDIQQGNIIERDKIKQLQPGMTKRQVRYLLGTPLVVDTFDQNHWEYYYGFKDGKDNFHQEKLVLLFDNGQLSKIDNEIPADNPLPIVSTDQAKLPDPDPDAKKGH